MVVQNERLLTFNYYITIMSKNICNIDTNLATPLLNEIERYAKENNYDYIVLHAGTDRDYLIGEGERPGLYIKNGYRKDRILKAGEGGFSDIDLWILYKHIK